MNEKKQQNEVVLTSAQLKKIAETASQVAIESYHKEVEKQRQENKDKRLYNTKLLMERYRGMVEYAKDAIYDAKQMNKDYELQTLLELMSNQGDDGILSVESIQARAVRTRIILAHVEKMLDFYRYECERSRKKDAKIKWNVIKSVYLEEDAKTVSELSDELAIDESRLETCVDNAISELSALFFGSMD